MGNTNTHKVCSVGIELSAYHPFKFLVPNHLVDENGNIDEEIKEEIKDRFDYTGLTISDCDYNYGDSRYEVRDDFSVEKDCGYEDREMQTLLIFGDDE